MKKTLFLFLVCVTTGLSATAQTEEVDQAAILAVMKAQEQAWGRGDLEGFMQGYWKNDSLKFYGSHGIASGWQKTLDNYKKSYPTKAHTGTLTFVIDALSKIEDGAYYVMGQYHLKRDMGNANGVFMIIFRKIDGAWKIVADLSCG